MKKARYSLWIVCLTLCFLFLYTCGTRLWEQRKFGRLTRELLEEEYGSDLLSRHFSFKNPKEFGISHPEKDVTDASQGCLLPCYSRESYQRQGEKEGELLAELSEINAKKLSKKGRESYEILTAYLREQKEGSRYLYFEEPLSPTGGIHISLPVLLSEYEMATEEDAKSYLALLASLPAYFEGLAAYEADKAQAGRFMASEDVDLVITQCDYLASECGKRLFTACFQNGLSHLEKLSEEDRAFYLAEHERIFATQVSCAYTKLADSLLLLREDGKEQKGLCQYPQGKAYYAARLRRLIGTDKEVTEIEKSLKNRMAYLYKELLKEQEKLKKKEKVQNAAERNRKEQAAQEQYKEKQKETKKDESKQKGKKQGEQKTELQGENEQGTENVSRQMEDCLMKVQAAMKEQLPALSAKGQVTIKQIPDALLSYTAPAYYFVPRIQKCKKGSIFEIENIIYVNPSAAQDSVNLFATLAHEGYPGHMFQNMYFLSSQGVSGENVLRYCMDFPGYSEGWAMYVELMAYDYAGAYADAGEDMRRLLKLSREIQLCMLSYLDIQIHYRGADMRQIAPYLAKIGVRDAQSLHDVYAYLINEPGTYLKYYAGYLELLECRELYQQKQRAAGKKYSDRDFHRFFLTHGPDRYDRIREALR